MSDYSSDAYARAVENAGEQGVGWVTIDDHAGLLAVAPAHPRWDPIRAAEASEDERAGLYDEAFRPAYEAFTAASVTAEDTRVYVWDTSAGRAR